MKQHNRNDELIDFNKYCKNIEHPCMHLSFTTLTIS